MSGQVKRYEYGYVHCSVPIFEWDEAMEIGVVYARDKREAESLAWDSLPGYDYTIIMIKER